MRIRKGFEVKDINVNVFPPESLKAVETVEIELLAREDLIDTDTTDRTEALILAEIAESIGNHKYYADPTLEKVAIASFAVVEQANNVIINEDLDVSKPENLKRALRTIGEVLESLEDVKGYITETLEEIETFAVTDKTAA